MNARLYPMLPKQIKNQLSVTINGIVNITMACLALVLTWFKDNLLWWEHAGILLWWVRAFICWHGHILSLNLPTLL